MSSLPRPAQRVGGSERPRARHPWDDESRRVRWTRRAVSIPAYLLLTVLLLLALPVLLPALTVFDLLARRRLAGVRTLLAALHYLACESVGLAASLVLWLARALPGVDAARDAAWHVTLQRCWASTLLAGISRLFSLRIEIEGDEPGPRPLLVFVRHASLVDTLLPVALLTRRYGLRLRYVMKRELLWDPCLDVVGHRLPNLFVHRESGESEREIEKVRQLAQDIGPGEAVLIYPEGTRFSDAKRERALERIRRSSDPGRLAQARELRHVLPPRSGGPTALLDARPDADVLLVGHTGFEGISHFRDAWNGTLIGRRIKLRCWLLPSGSIPSGRTAQLDWLYAQWRQLDAWVGAQLDEVTNA